MTRAGVAAAAALGVAAWGNAASPWHLAPAALLTAVGWALTSGAAINSLVPPWFDRRRPAALAMAKAHNGAGAGGVVFTPLWAALIAAWGVGPASLAVALAAAAGGNPALLLVGAVLFGLGIGNLLSLPPLIAQRDRPHAEVARVAAVATAVNQASYAFGPGLFGAALEAFGAWAPPAAAGRGPSASAAEANSAAVSDGAGRPSR